VIEPRVLLDTNILIYLIGATEPGLRGRVEALQPGEAVTSAICVAEVAVGLRDAEPRVHAALEQLYRQVVPVPFDRAAAERFGALPYKRGKTDRLIGAHALALGLTLVTNNERDFAEIPGLKVENWTTA
jgi:tRNA(fMet)-specific endonuclease VapC